MQAYTQITFGIRLIDLPESVREKIRWFELHDHDTKNGFDVIIASVGEGYVGEDYGEILVLEEIKKPEKFLHFVPFSFIEKYKNLKDTFMENPGTKKLFDVLELHDFKDKADLYIHCVEY